MKRRPFVHVVCIVALSLLLVGCEAMLPVVGVLEPQTGVARAYGNAVGNGIEIAVAQAEAEARLPAGFSIVDVDTGSDPALAVAAYRRLVEENGVRLVLGGMTSEEASALVEVADATRTICLSPSASRTDLAARSRFVFRLFPTDEAEGRTAARHLYDTMAVRSVVVFTDDSALTRGLETEFRQNFELKLSGRIAATIHLGREGWRQRAADALLAHEPQGVYVVGHAENILTVMTHLEQRNYGGVRMTTSTFYLADVLGAAGDAADGVIFPLSPFDAQSLVEPTNRFAADYRGRFGTEPDIYAANGYDAMRVAIHALATSERLYTPELRKALHHGMGDFRGVTGAISFNDHGDVRRYPVMHVVESGRVLTWETARQRRLDAARDALRRLEHRSESKRLSGTSA